MIIVKFIVFFGFNSVFSAVQMNYCKISYNHTLCLYKTPGPSPSCKFYDKTALLSSQEIKELVHKINERRHYIAIGRSHLPRAANMKKIRWSTELANFAQRWADQCDPSLRPDKEDECRDLENTKVGQNIGSVTGRSSLNVRNFVEMWFSQILNYAGTVTCYNQSRDYNTNYFTQLIWAETEFVGCGKVKFYRDDKNFMIERLVCNFAPKGNVNGKPIYIIGYPGTKCVNNNISEKKYRGLCDYERPKKLRQLTTQGSLVSNLFRVYNLSNDLICHESNPVSSHSKQAKFRRIHKKNKKIRHVLSNYSYETVRRAPLRRQNMKKSLTHKMPSSMNNNDDHYQYDRGHSRLYHGHEEPVYPIPDYHERNNNQDDTVAPIYLISSPNYIKDNQYILQPTSEGVPKQFFCYDHQCTRDQFHCCDQSIGWQSEKLTNPTTSSHLCPTTTSCAVTCPNTCLPLITTVDISNRNCKCSRHDFQSYNDIPNMVRSGNHRTTVEQYYDKKNKINKIYDKKENDRIHQHNDEMVYPRYDIRDRDYYYRAFDSSIKKKRTIEDKTWASKRLIKKI